MPCRTYAGRRNEARESEDYRVQGVGNLQKNEVDALVRSLKLKDYLRENRLTAGTPLEVTWISEDWDSIAALVKQSDMMFREATLDLIGNVDIDKGRERMLMRLADGKPYKYLAEKIFPEVMRWTTDKVHPPAAGCGGESGGYSAPANVGRSA